MNYYLPKSLTVDGVDYEIRTDYRVILDIMEALADPELTDEDKAEVAFEVLYPDYEKIPPQAKFEAIERAYWFINGGRTDDGKVTPKVMDWEQDFEYIAAPISKAYGQDIRGVAHLHWWTFLSYYMEIGDCTFAQIVSIREKRRKGKLEKWEREWYRKNKDLVDFKVRYTDTEKDLLEQWTGEKHGK